MYEKVRKVSIIEYGILAICYGLRTTPTSPTKNLVLKQLLSVPQKVHRPEQPSPPASPAAS